ncbi:MAG: carboxypeptidase-like regulatory domain-containing protein [Bacteroidota bacterium]|nr:carboxypeptidase-like regulatory domain-containing protein [Bacteroidota bacterium]
MKKNLYSFLNYLIFSFLIFTGTNASCQIAISGTVYDSSKIYEIPGVNVYSTSGSSAITDSLGAYHINVSETDSLRFFYQGKSTIKFPVKNMNNYTAVDISLRVRVNEKYKLLQGVTVFSDTYRRDSLENRVSYSKVFGREKPTIRSTYEPGGPAGLDVDALIGMFQFKKNKQNIAFQKRLVDDEKEQYINYRFNSKTITRITGLHGDTLLKYKTLYRPDYFFVTTSTLAEFYEYILNTSYAFKKENGIQ